MNRVFPDDLEILDVAQGLLSVRMDHQTPPQSRSLLFYVIYPSKLGVFSAETAKVR
jgi:hypothetical protein